MPFIGEALFCGREDDDDHNIYALAIYIILYKSDEVVSHVPHTILYFCSSFIRWGGTIKCTVVGNRCFSQDLDQGGMEIPCKCTFKGQPEEVDKFHKFFCGASTDMILKIF